MTTININASSSAAINANNNNTNQLPLILSEKNEIKRCVMHMWRSYDGIGLNLKNSKKEGFLPHVIRDVDLDSPAQYAGVLNNDLIIKVGNRVVEYEKFDVVLKLIKDQLKRDKKIDLVLINQNYYTEFKRKNQQGNNKQIDYNSPGILAQMKYYESPLHNPNSMSTFRSSEGAAANLIANSSNTFQNVSNYDTAPEPRLCHLLTWPNYDGYGFFVLYNNEGCFVKNVEPNSPAQLGGLQAYDRIIEINGKKVRDYKDRESVMKDINRLKFSDTLNTNAGTKNRNSTLRSQSAYSNISFTSSASNRNYLNILVADPNTYNWLTSKKIDISTRNKALKIRECFTPSEQQYQTQSVPQAQNPTRPSSPIINQANGSLFQLKKCLIRKNQGIENQLLGFEMTKRGSSAHFISRVEPGSIASMSGLSVDDYLIELNDENIEKDENNLLRDKMFSKLGSSGQFQLTTINKNAYDYCTENKLLISDFIRANKDSIKYYETPVITTTNMNTPMSKTLIPRLCVLKKTNEDKELGFAIARLKNVNEHVINDVVAGSLADRAGLRPNDRLIEVNGENVESKSHSETVNKIIDLARDPNASISLLVIERSSPPPMSTSSTLYSNNTTASNAQTLPNPVISINHVDHNNINHVNEAQPNLNVYPEIKVCEFFGYPMGTQLGLVVTSDNESHDVVKVAPDSPASKAGFVAGDVIVEINGINIEGDSTAIELLNDFSELKPLKVIVASRYTHEWSKLLRIKITEKDWPNIKKYSTKFSPLENKTYNIKINNVSTSTHQPTTSTSLRAPLAYQDSHNKNIIINKNMSINETYLNDEFSYKKSLRSSKTAAPVHMNTLFDYNMSNTRATSCSNEDIANRSFVNVYNEIPIINTSGSRKHHRNYPSTKLPKRGLSSGNTIHSTNTDQLSLLSVLSRSAVDITTSDKVLRMCTLILDPTSPNPNDAEFGFDLVTKVGSQRIGDYYIDTIDEDSPACTSGLKSGDRLVEVDGIDVRNKTFEQVVQLINEAKLRCKLKLLVYPSCIINYGNPNVSNDNIQPHQSQPITVNLNYNDSKSMPDLTAPNNQMYANKNIHHYSTVQQGSGHSGYMMPPQISPPQPHLHNHLTTTYYEKNLHKHHKQSNHSTNTSTSKHYNHLTTTDFESNGNNNLGRSYNLSKSFNNLNFNDNDYNGSNNYFNKSMTDLSYKSRSYLRPVPRLCTLYKNDPMNQKLAVSSNIGFGVQTRSNSSLIPNYMRISIVNYKSPAYLSGLEAGDFIIEVNGRSTLSMSQEETLHFIKSSYEQNNYARLLVVSEFTYNWLKENDLLNTLNSDDNSIFSYSDYLRNNHRYVPRLCKLRLMSYNKSFGFQIETIAMKSHLNSTTGNKQIYAHLITKVDRDSPASACKLQKADRIIECDGINVEADNDVQIGDRIYQAFMSARQISLLVVDPDTDNYFKSKCIKLHSMLPIIQHITNSSSS